MDQTTPHPFIGREALLDEVKRHLLKGQHVALYGDRGIGKTAVVERIVQWLREERPQVRFVHIADEMTFKDLLVLLARELHALKLFRHPLIPDEEVRELEWPQISKKTKALALRELAAAIVTSLRGEGVLPGLDPGLNRVKPTDQAWLEDPGLDPGSVCLIATRDRDEKNLKPLLLRFQAIEVPPLKKREAYELMEALLAEKPVPSMDPAFFQRSVWEASRGYPSAIRDLIWKGSLEKYVDREQIRAIHHEAGVKGFSIAPLVVIPGFRRSGAGSDGHPGHLALRGPGGRGPGRADHRGGRGGGVHGGPVLYEEGKVKGAGQRGGQDQRLNLGATGRKVPWDSFGPKTSSPHS